MRLFPIVVVTPVRSCLAGAAVGLCFLSGGCAEGESSLSNTEQRESVAVAAIEAFDEVYPTGPHDVERIVVRPDDLAEVDVVDGRQVVTQAPALGPFWRLRLVIDRGDYWEVTIESVSGSDFFAGSVFVVVDGGNGVVVTPDDVGATATTSVS